MLGDDALTRASDRSQEPRVSVHALDNAHVPLARAAESSECLLIGWTVVRGNCLFDAIKFNGNCAFSDTLLIRFNRTTSRKKASLVGDHRVMFGSSLSVGVSALAASALGFFGTATFFGSFLVRREKKSSALELAGIGAIALVLVIAAFGLMLWSGFSISFDGVLIPGPYWVVVGMVTALLVTTKQIAL